MDKDQGWEIIHKQETGSMSRRETPKQPTEMGPPKPPDKVSSTPRTEEGLVPKSKRQHHEHGHEASINNRRKTSDAAEGVMQNGERAREPKEQSYLLPPEQLISTQSPCSTDSCPGPQRHSHAPADTGVEANASMELRLWRENDELRQALVSEGSRAAQAERAADELRAYSRTKELQLQASMAAVASDTHALGQEAAKLRKENGALKAELDDARSHIFSLQPYRKELTPKEVEQDYDDLVTSVSEWVQRLADPIIDNEEVFQHTLGKARKHPDEVENLRAFVKRYPDLTHGCLFPETDVDILISVVLRYLNDNVFQKGLPGRVRHLGESIAHIEGLMQSHVKPQRDQFAIRTWRGEAFNAILCSPDYDAERKSWMKELTLNIAMGFKIFHKDREHAVFCFGCQENVVKPALALHEKLLTSTHHFYLDVSPYIVWNADRELETSPDFFDHLDQLSCENVLQSRKRLSLDKMDPRPTVEELKRDLRNVMTVCPALYMRQIGKGDTIRPPVVVRKQQVLVAYGGEEKMKEFAETGRRTLMSHIYFGPKDKDKDQTTGEGPWASLKHISWS